MFHPASPRRVGDPRSKDLFPAEASHPGSPDGHTAQGRGLSERTLSYTTVLPTQAGVNGEAGFGSVCQGSGLGFDPWSVSQHFSSVAVSSAHEHLT